MTAKLFRTENELAIGVVLVVHGLNNKPEVMDDLVAVLVNNGFHCVRVSLYADSPGERSTPRDTEQVWTDNITDAYNDAVHRFAHLPICALSYSLGALATISFLDARAGQTFETMVLLAPPVALTRSASLVRALTPLARFGAVLPSAAPKKIRARRGTPISEYAAMLKIGGDVYTLKHPKTLGQIPTVVYLDPDDELVDYNGVLEWIDRNDLEMWTPKGFKDRAPEGRTYSHLMVLEESLGAAAWTALTHDIVTHFKQPT